MSGVKKPTMKARPKKPYRYSTRIENSEPAKPEWENSIREEINELRETVLSLKYEVWEIKNPPLFELGQQIPIGIIEKINVERRINGAIIRMYSVRLPKTDGLGDECVTEFKEDMLKRVLQYAPIT